MTSPIERSELTLEERRIFEFLLRLERAERSGRANLTDWESHFLRDLLANPRPLTPAQREKVDQLRTQHRACV